MHKSVFNVLIIGTGTQGQVCAKSLKKKGHRIFLLYGGRHNYADDSRYVDRKIECHYSYSSDEYLDTVMSVVKSCHIDTIVPMGDEAALFMSRRKKELLEVADFVLPDIDVFEKGYDKNQLMAVCAKGGYPHPQTVNDVEDLDSIDIDSLPYPVLIKPNHTSGGRGMTLVRNKEELLSRFLDIRNSFGPCHLQKFIRSGGKQIKVQIYINEKRELVASSVLQKLRWYPEKGGSNCCAECIRNDEVVDLCCHILKDIGWIGFADFDLIEDPDEGVLKVMEINPRVPACLKGAVVAGIDWPNIIVNEYMNLPQEEIRFKPGQILRHLGLEVLWFYYSKNRFRAKPSIFRFFGKDIHYQDLDCSDLRPFFWGTWHNIRQQMNPAFRKKKTGIK